MSCPADISRLKSPIYMIPFRFLSIFSAASEQVVIKSATLHLSADRYQTETRKQVLLLPLISKQIDSSPAEFQYGSPVSCNSGTDIG